MVAIIRSNEPLILRNITTARQSLESTIVRVNSKLLEPNLSVSDLVALERLINSEIAAARTPFSNARDLANRFTEFTEVKLEVDRTQTALSELVDLRKRVQDLRVIAETPVVPPVDTPEVREANNQTGEESQNQVFGQHGAGTNINTDANKSSNQNPEGVTTDNVPGVVANDGTNNVPLILRKVKEATERTINTKVNARSSEDNAKIAVGNNDTQIGDAPSFPRGFFEPIVTQDNPLLQFDHYTYNVAIYLQKPEQYKRMVVTGNKDLTSYKKVLQSGGTGGDIADAIFPDLFIDNLEIQTLMMGNNPGAHNAVDLNFTIIEPMGFTFLQKLRDLCTDNDMFGLTNQHYLMVIKFIGYDENGKEITPDNADAMAKYIPFKFSKITTTVRTGAAEYACMAVPPNYNIGQSVKRAVIKFNVELVGRSLNDIFNADGDTSAVSSNQVNANQRDPNESSYQPSNSNAGPKISTQGVIKALNQEQREFVKRGKQSLPDTFKVTFKDDIGNFKVVQNKALQLNKKATPMDPKATQAKEATQETGMDTSIQKYSTVAGMPIVEFIDKMMRSSDYITKQQNFQVDGKSGQLVQTPGNKPFLQWYNISTIVLPGEFDQKRRDYAYNIEYVISKKEVGDAYSPYFNRKKFLGVHKKYNYWFTGENTEVLDFEQELNAAFYVAMDNRAPEKDKESTDKTHVETTYAVVGNDELNDTGDAAEKVSGILYSPVDFAKSIMTIHGDPDYIQQSEIFYEPGYYEPFMQDGSVNYESREILYSMYFRTMEDYNDLTGEADLIDPQLKDDQERKATNNNPALIYRLIRATNRFSDGKFTQELEGLIREFDQKEVKNNPEIARPKQLNNQVDKIVKRQKTQQIDMLQEARDSANKIRIEQGEKVSPLGQETSVARRRRLRTRTFDRDN